MEESTTTTKKAAKVQEVIGQVLTEYKNVPVVCTKCGDKIRTNNDNEVYCPNNEPNCPLIK